MMLPKVGDVVIGVVAKVYRNYAIMVFDGGYTGLLHISELSHRFIRSFSGYCKVGNVYTVKVLSVDEEKQNVKVSLKEVTNQDRKDSLKTEPIPAEKADFSKLAELLPSWIEEAIDKEESK